MSRYLVTGGLGVIGSRIATALLDEGHSVVIVDAAEEPRNEWIAVPLEKRATILRGRLEEHGDHLKEILDDADAVIHCAAHTGIPHSLIDPSDDWRSNVDATKVLLEALRVTPRPTIVLSSIKPYRVDPMPENGLDESAVLEPDEPYAASKAAQSMLCQAYARSYGLPVVTFRCSNLYGPAPCHGPRHGWLTWMCISAAIGRPLEIQGTGEQTRDMLYADDVLSACKAAIEHMGAVSGRTFNLGGGQDNRISVEAAALALRSMTGVEIKYAPARNMDDLHVFVNSGAMLKATGWRPLVGVHDGLSRVLAWARQNKQDMAKLFGDM